jgi:hypothetical protein
MTLREFSALMDRFREREELAFLRAGIVASTIANCNRGPNSEAFTPQDFMPSSSFSNHEESHEPTREEFMADMRALNASFGGQDLTNEDLTRG